MLRLSEEYNYFLYNNYCDMRKGLHTLCALIRDGIGEDPTNTNNVYVFLGKSRRLVKILRYERGFFVLYVKRPLQGRFRKPVFSDSGQRFQVSWGDLFSLLEGIVVDTLPISRTETGCSGFSTTLL